jgi:hypothetical protein
MTSGFFESRMRSGLVVSRRRESSSSLSTCALKYVTSVSRYAARSSGSPSELTVTSRLLAGSPNRSSIITIIPIISASSDGSAAPNTSAPIWWNWRRRPRCARSCRNIAPR